MNTQSNKKPVVKTEKATVVAILGGVIIFSNTESYIVTADFPNIEQDQEWEISYDKDGNFVSAKWVEQKE